MVEFFKSLSTQYNSPGGSTLRNLVKGMWQDVAPQGTATPYITFSFISSTTDRTFDTFDDMPLIQFSIWDDKKIEGAQVTRSPKETMEIAEALIALYKDQLLVVTGYSVIRADKVGERLLRDPDVGWQYIVEFLYMLEQAV